MTLTKSDTSTNDTFTNDTMTITKLKVNGIPHIIEEILDILYTNDKTRLWYSEKFFESCEHLINTSIEDFDYTTFITCDEYEIKLYRDGNHYLYMCHY